MMLEAQLCCTSFLLWVLETVLCQTCCIGGMQLIMPNCLTTAEKDYLLALSVKSDFSSSFSDWKKCVHRELKV
jgi:hypothetical protein